MSSHTPNNTGFDEIVSDDRTCANCDYALAGLPINGTCPECGTPIPRRTSAKLPSGDNLTDAPIGYLRQLAFSLVMLSIGAAGIGFGLIMLRASSDWTARAVFSAATVMWIMSVWMITVRRPKQEATVTDHILDNQKWLLTVRLTQITWFVSAAFAWLHWIAVDQSWANLIGTARAMHVLLVMLSFGASVFVLAYLSALSDWAGDGSLAGRTRGAAWAVVLGGVVGGGALTIAPGMGTIRGPIYFVAVLFLLLFLAGVIIALISVFQIAATSMRAISSNRATEARNIRVAERRAREMEETVNRQLEANAQFSAKPPPPANLSESDSFVEEGKKFQISGHRIEQSDSDETYDLAPEDS